MDLLFSDLRHTNCVACHVRIKQEKIDQLQHAEEQSSDFQPIKFIMT